MSATAKHALVGLFLACFAGVLVAFNASKPRILVVHASSEASRWAAGVDAGVDRVLAANRRPLSVRRHYLRLDRLVRPEARAAAVAEARRAIELFDPDLLIAVDDESNEAVASGYVGRSRPRIIYVSIDQLPERYGYSKAAGNVTGILEELPLAAIRDAVSAIRGGGAAAISAIGVENDTGRAERMQVEAFDWSPHRLVALVTLGDLVAWKKFVESDAARADVLLVLSSAGLARDAGSSETTAGSEVAAWIEEHASALPIGVHAGFVADGGGLAISPAGADYGSRGMAMAIRWLDDLDGPPPPPMTSGHFDVSVNPGRLRARGVVLPPIYEEAARAAGSLFLPLPSPAAHSAQSSPESAGGWASPGPDRDDAAGQAEKAEFRR